MSDLDLQFKLRLAHCKVHGSYELTLSLPEISIEVEVSGRDLERVVIDGARLMAERLDEHGYSVSSEDVLSTIEATIEEYNRRQKELN